MSPLLWAFLLTAFVEGAAVGLAFRKLRPVYISLLCNLLTNPATNVLLAVLVMWLGSRAYYPVLLCLELAAVGVETWVYCLLAGWPWKKALLCSFAVNALSCGVGLLLL